MKANRFKAIGVLLLSCSLASCLKKADTGPTVNGSSTVEEIIKNAGALSIWNAALEKTGLDSTLNGPGPFTVLLATDISCSNDGFSEAYINSLSAEKLDTLLKYAIIPANYPALNFPAGPNAPIITAGGDSIFVTSTYKGIFINGIPITQADVTGSNGVIHALYYPLVPPSGNLWQLVAADSSFSFFQAAVTKAANANADIQSMLTTEGIHTLFAPTNNAFRGAGYATMDSVMNAPADSLAKLVTYHMLNGRTFTSDFTQGLEVATVNGETIILSPDGYASVAGKNSTGWSRILAGNILARNGVFHKIDGLLLP